MVHKSLGQRQQVHTLYHEEGSFLLCAYLYSLPPAQILNKDKNNINNKSGEDVVFHDSSVMVVNTGRAIKWDILHGLWRLTLYIPGDPQSVLFVLSLLGTRFAAITALPTCRKQSP